MVRRLIFLLCLIAVGIAHSLQTNELDNPIDHAINFTERNFPADSGWSVDVYRQKRTFVDVLFKGLVMLSKGANLGLNLANVITEGCFYFPSICTDKKEIERLDEIIKKNTKLYETEYLQARQSYLDLKIATINNGYISYHINQTMQIVENIRDIEEKLSLALQIKLPKIDAVSKNQTFERHLEQAVGKLDNSLSELNSMLTKYKQNALIGIVVQFVVEVAVNQFIKFVSSLKAAYTEAKFEKKVGNYIAKFAKDNKLNMKKPNSPGPKQTSFRKRIKFLSNVFGKMKRNFNFKDFKERFKTSFRNFKATFSEALKSPLTQLNQAKTFFQNKITNFVNKVNKYEMDLSDRISGGISIILDIVSQFLSAKDWQKAATEMTKARKNYQEYNDKLDKELKEILIEQTKMNGIWNVEIEVFQKLSLSFKFLVINASKYSNFSDVIGFSKLPVNLSNALFTIDFDNITKQSIGSSQSTVLNFLKEVDYNFTVIEDEFKAKEIFYNITLSKSEKDESVHEMLSYISSILKFSPSKTMKRLGGEVKERDMVCTISILRYDIDEYDFFPLEPFRPRCEVNSSIFDVMASQATSKRNSKLTLEIVTNSLKTDKVDSLSKLVDSVHSAYMGVTDKSLAAFGRSITDQDIICMISKKFPSRETYDYINLDHFRPNCSSVNPDRFKALLQDASNQRRLAVGIKSELQTCQEYKFCRCLKSLAQQYQLTEIDVTDAIKKLNPAWEENQEAVLCGPPCNSCVHL